MADSPPFFLSLFESYFTISGSVSPVLCFSLLPPFFLFPGVWVLDVSVEKGCSSGLGVIGRQRNKKK